MRNKTLQLFTAMSQVIGIDFGTENIGAAVSSGGKITRLSYGNAYKFPACVAFKQNVIYTGEMAILRKKMGQKDTVYNILQLLGRKLEDIEDLDFGNRLDRGLLGEPILYIGDRAMHAEQLCAFLLEHALNQADEDIKQCVLTVPSCFTSCQRQALIDSAKFCGLEVLRLVNETTAAAIAFCNDYAGERLLVFHLGAYSCDFSMMETAKGSIRVIQTKSIPNIGGIQIAKLCFDWLCKNHACLKESRRQGEIKSSVVDAIKGLSVQTEVEIDCAELVTITRDNLNRLIAPIINTITNTLERLLKQFGLSKNNLEVLLIGGCTKIKAVESIFSEFKTVHNSSRNEYLAAEGAALLGERELQLHEISQLELHIGASIIPSQQNLPVVYNTDDSDFKISQVFEGKKYLIDNFINNVKSLTLTLDESGILHTYINERVDVQGEERSQKLLHICDEEKNFKLLKMSLSNEEFIKDVRNKLQATISRFKPIVEGMEISEKYKVIFNNIADDVNIRFETCKSSHLMLIKRDAVIKYVEYLKSL